MRLPHFEDIIFDEIPKLYNPIQKIFLSNLLDMNKLKLSNNASKLSKIYTTRKLADQLLCYFGKYDFGMKRSMLTASNFIILTPYHPFELQLNDGQKIKVLACESSDASINIMFLIKKEKKSLPDLYAGIFTDIRTSLLNDIFADWIKQGINNLYVNLSRATEQTDYRTLNIAVEEIRNLIKYRKATKVHIKLPLFGYEPLIAKLLCRLQGCIAINNNLCDTYTKLLNIHLQSDSQRAKFVISQTELSETHSMSDFQLSNFATIKITDELKSSTDQNKNCSEYGYYKVFWSPIPTHFDLKLLARLVRPALILGITNARTLALAVPKLPLYLQQLQTQNTKMLTNPNLTPTSTRSWSKKTITPSRKTPLIFRIRKPNIRYLDDGDSDDSE